MFRALVLISASPLKHPALLQYLQKRKIDAYIAAKYLSQIDFKAPQGAKNTLALGHPAGNGFEARNALFKGFVGIGKNVTFHKGTSQTKPLIFEGFTDFLSYLTMKNLNEPDGDTTGAKLHGVLSGRCKSRKHCRYAVPLSQAQ